MRTSLRRRGFLWVTLGFFLLSLAGHWIFGWYAYLQEQSEHNMPVEVPDFLIEMTRDTLENWQSEFLQLMWQVAGLAFLLYVNSPQSREGDDRKEEKLDMILRTMDPEGAERTISKINKKHEFWK
jgi:lysylphosphatidylglycerol synthetase-like protein (DUF2156 family)